MLGAIGREWQETSVQYDGLAEAHSIEPCSPLQASTVQNRARCALLRWQERQLGWGRPVEVPSEDIPIGVRELAFRRC